MKKINVAELLKDCPKGMELDCTICNNVVTLEGVDTVGYYPIRITSKDGFNHVLTHEGCIYKREDAKCVIFPKGKTTWEGFVPPWEFKDGDRVVKKGDISTPVSIVRVGDKYYYHYSNTEGTIGLFPIAEQDDWELVFNKFDINTLKPFDRVLVRDNNTQKWTADLFSFYDKSLVCPYSCVGHYTNQCIPYEGNEHLLGKTDDCDNFYKTWE